MYKSLKIIAIVMARGGSKGIKLKNLKKINGTSLVGITAKFCQNIKIFDQSIISTDHDLIGKEGRLNGLEFFFKRPKNISGSLVADEEVLRHALIKAEKYFKSNFDLVVSLPPTSPLRKKNDILKAIKKLIKNKHDSVWTLSETDSKSHPLKQLVIRKKKIKFYDKKGKFIFARQQLSKVYHRNGCAYVITRKALLDKKKLFTNNTGYYVVKSAQISIDTLDDIKFAGRHFN